MPKKCDRCGERLDKGDAYYGLELPPDRVMWCCEVCHDALEEMDDDEFTNEIYGDAGADR